MRVLRPVSKSLRRTGPQLFLFISSMLLFASSCGGGSEADAPSTATEQPSTGNTFGGAPPSYPEPVEVVPGEYRSPASNDEAWERGMIAEAEDSAKPRADTMVHGIRIIDNSVRNTDASFPTKVCDGGKIVEFREVSDIEFHYLPPGTYALGPQAASICDDGSTAGFGRYFAMRDAEFNVWYEPGDPAIVVQASADRVKADVVNGRPAVVIPPVTAEGFGQSWIVVKMPNGVLTLGAFGLPFEETLKIAEGVKCPGC